MLVTTEQVSWGHPDKICDQISDAIVTDCLAHDRNSRVAAECMIKNVQIIIAGEITSTHMPCYETLTRGVLMRIGIDDAEKYKVTSLVTLQSPDIAQGVDTGGAGDQGIVIGYATNETPEFMPLPFMLATCALEFLRDMKRKELLPDAKSQVTFDYDKGRIDTFLISTQHRIDVSVQDITPLAVYAMRQAAERYGLNTDFKTLVNPTGRFVVGSSFADTGLTGRKIIADSYGPIAGHGGGAFSGKDPTKIDRSGAYMARKIARLFVSAGMARTCVVQIAYAIGVAEPVSMYVQCIDLDGAEAEIAFMLRDKYDLTPGGIIKTLGLLEVDYNKTSAYGHFGKPDLPWEQAC